MHNLFDLSVELQSQGSIYHFMEIQSFPTANETFSCQLTPEVLNWDEDLVLCRPVKFFHTDWINHFLFEPCLIHRDIVMLE